MGEACGHGFPVGTEDSEQPAHVPDASHGFRITQERGRGVGTRPGDTQEARRRSVLSGSWLDNNSADPFRSLPRSVVEELNRDPCRPPQQMQAHADDPGRDDRRHMQVARRGTG